MIRSLMCALLIVCTSAVGAQAQEWAKKMFKVTEHDFGTVARAAKAEFAFELTNLYEEDIHIAGVRSSCGCTTPTVSKQTLKTWEKSQILATFNTRTFVGQKAATITVTIDQPYYAEVQLQVRGFIRSDVVFQPGSIEFGEVEQSSPAEQQVTVTYAGRSDWRILDVRSGNPHFEVELQETERQTGRVAYSMLVRLKPDAPAGYFQDQLTLVTDDQALRNVAVPVDGRVVSPLTVSPAALFLGVLQPGQTVTKRLVVRGKKPFTVREIDCENSGFEFKKDDESKNLHLVPVTFTAGSEPGNVKQTIKIQTDVGEVECIATATVQEAN